MDALQHECNRITRASLCSGSEPVLQSCRVILKIGPKPLTEALKLMDADAAVAVDVAPYIMPSAAG